MPTSMSPIWSPFYITDAGLAMRATAIATKGQITFTHAMVGEGKPDNELEIGQMDSLVSPVYTAWVKSSYAQAANHIMVIEVNNRSPEIYEREVLVTEIAVYARLEGTDTTILYGYAYCLSGYAPMPEGNSSHRIWSMVFDTKISNTSDVTIVYDGSGLFVSHDDLNNALAGIYTKGDVDDLLEDINPVKHNADPGSHPDIREELKDINTALSNKANQINELFTQVELLKDIIFSDIQGDKNIYLVSNGLSDFRVSSGIHNRTNGQLEC